VTSPALDRLIPFLHSIRSHLWLSRCHRSELFWSRNGHGIWRGGILSQQGGRGQQRKSE
jgi:hypothetical protein